MPSVIMPSCSDFSSLKMLIYLASPIPTPMFILGDTASNLGSAVDELMRHQPTLKTDATTAIIKVRAQENVPCYTALCFITVNPMSFSR